MPTLHAGVDHNREEWRIVHATTGQLRRLGFAEKEKPEKIGFGGEACVYAPAAGGVVKITKDAQDALCSWLVLSQGIAPPWAIPVRAVYRMPAETYAIVAERAEELPGDWSEPITIMFRRAKAWKLPANARDGRDMDRFYRMIIANIRQEKWQPGGITSLGQNMMRAAETMSEAMLALRSWGFDWVDAHAGNLGMYGGRPRIVDFGAQVREGREADTHPRLREIPVLEF